MLTNHDPDSQRVVYDTLKEYPDMFKIIIYREPRVYPKIQYGKRRQPISEDDLKNFVANQRSVIRTRVNLSDLIECNKFQYFCTFTFDKLKHDRYDITHCTRVVNRFFQNARYNHSPNLQYLVVPELHKDGAIHFHALISHYYGRLTDSKHKKSGRTIYNISGYRAGFSTAVPIEGNHEAVATYVKKYITKDMIKLFNKKRYFCSRNLKRPTKRYNVVDYFKTLWPEPTYQNLDLEMYHLNHNQIKTLT